MYLPEPFVSDAENLALLLLSNQAGAALTQKLASRDHYSIPNHSGMDNQARAHAVALAAEDDLEGFAKLLVELKFRTWCAVRRLRPRNGGTANWQPMRAVLADSPILEGILSGWARIDQDTYIGRDSTTLKGDESQMVVWLVVAHLHRDDDGRPTHVSFHWKRNTRSSSSQHEVVGRLMELWSRTAGYNLEKVAMKRIAMEAWWERYRRKEGRDWHDMAIFADRKGLRLRARAQAGTANVDDDADDDDGDADISAGSEMDFESLEGLAHTLSRAALGKRADWPRGEADYDALQGVGTHRVLDVMLRDWSPVTYEVAFNHDEGHLRAHLYFGTGPGMYGFQVVRCYAGGGGDELVARVLVQDDRGLGA